MKPSASWRSMIAAAVCVVALTTAPAVHAQQSPTAKDLSTVIEMLRSPDPVVRVGVACAKDVFNESATAAIPALIDLLNDAEPVSPAPVKIENGPALVQITGRVSQ